MNSTYSKLQNIRANTNIEDIDRYSVFALSLSRVSLDKISKKIIKRTFDIVFSYILITILSPMFLILAIIIKFDSPGSVFFRQERIGVNNKEFLMLKLRSMKKGSEKYDHLSQSTRRDDRRITRFGKFLRKTNLDELPQFFNIIAGHMSVVGPRPERPYWVNKIKKEIPNYLARNYVKPGITGWAQINGWRGDTSILKRINCDLYYIQNWSFFLDIRIIVITIIKFFPFGLISLKSRNS